MTSNGEAKLYYLFMMSDGEVSANEKKLFNSICKKLYLSKERKKSVIDECKEISSVHNMNCIDVIKKNVEEYQMFNIFELDLSRCDSDEDNAAKLWNLINLGYADTHYTCEEREVVDYLRKYWKVKDSLYREMIDVAETALALEKHKKWIEKELPESEIKQAKIKQINKDIRYVQKTIEMTISEISF